MKRALGIGFIFGATALALVACSTGGGGGGGAGGTAGSGTGGTGTGGTGTGGTGTGGSGTGGGSSTADCNGACAKASAAACPNDDPSTCVSDCQSASSQVPANCQSAYAAVINCAASSGTFTCDANGEAELGGCDSETSAFSTCLTSGTGGTGGTGGGGTGGGSSVTLPAGCVTASNVTVGCNPVTNEGCTGTGEACDFGTDSSSNQGFGCFPPPNDVQPGGTCDPANGPFCIPTHTCNQNVCKKWCCADSDCSGSTCTPLDPNLGTIGTCG